MLRSLAVLSLLLVGAGVAYAQQATTEAPEMKALVDAGKLPPVPGRTGSEPMLIEPTEEVGTYGGTWRLAMNGVGDRSSVMTAVTYEPLMRWLPDGSGVVPNVAKAIDVSPDVKVFTVHLRKGMKWSDGEPFGADDFMFWFHDVLLDPDLSPSGAPDWLVQQGVPPKVEKIDGETFTFTFEKPNGLFLQQLAQLRVYPSVPTMTPAHYLKQFHKKYADPAALEKATKDGGFDSWPKLFASKNDELVNPDRPTIYPWDLTHGIGDGEYLTFTRNPYYWKVDPKGQQLPYLNDVSVAAVQNQEVILAKAVNGEIDNQYWHLTFVENKPVLSQNPDLRFYTAKDPNPNSVALVFNYNNKDEVKRKVFEDKNFRIALSLAIDRGSINDLVFLGRATPYQVAPNPDSKYYSEEAAYQFTEFDPEKAKKVLDDAGYKRDGQGFILMPDGRPLEVYIITSNHKQERVDAGQLVTEYWNAIGVKTFFLSIDQTLYNQKRYDNDFDVAEWVANGGANSDILINPVYFVPLNTLSSQAMLFALYRQTGGKQGVKPTGDWATVSDLYDEILVTGDPAKQEELMKQIIDLNRKNFWTIGVVQPPLGIGVTKKDFRNVAETLLDVTLTGGYGPTRPEQYFWKK